MVTPEMASYFAEQIADNARKGLVNEVSDIHLVKGDLAEAWSEADADYATAAMRFSLIDVTRERTSGRIVAGDPANPVEVAELWTSAASPAAGLTAGACRRSSRRNEVARTILGRGGHRRATAQRRARVLRRRYSKLTSNWSGRVSLY